MMLRYGRALHGLILIGLILCSWFAGISLAWAEVAVPPLKARVTDLTGTLSAGDSQALEARLTEFEQARGAQLAVLVVPTTQPETIEQFGIRVAEAWKLGRKGQDDGLLLLVAKEDRTVRIEVGYGLEGVIPDAVAKRVIEEIIVPAFRAGNFAAGIDAGMTRLMGLIAGEPLPEPSPAASGFTSLVSEDMAVAGLAAVAVLGGVLRAIFGQFLGAALTAGGAFIAAWFLLGELVQALVVAVIVFFVALLGLSGSGGSSSSGGSGGGFSGGGGGFGGGGASGRW